MTDVLFFLRQRLNTRDGTLTDPVMIDAPNLSPCHSLPLSSPLSLLFLSRPMLATRESAERARSVLTRSEVKVFAGIQM